ncbi:hypothetical protein BD410DRAFT_842779 [Rickenella mellea]|uniref:Uncharacterized protein n=1 Tax=Rickenella mellea TaxID=50990 RepID=A0A4Y7PVA1_9AGAM|nr:hypothetical protein BD410DRAFT_842779 [Rickenella mellea]
MSGDGTHIAKGAMTFKFQDTVQPEVLRRYEKESEDSVLAEFKDFETQFDGSRRTGAKWIAEAEQCVRDLKSSKLAGYNEGGGEIATESVNKKKGSAREIKMFKEQMTEA